MGVCSPDSVQDSVTIEVMVCLMGLQACTGVRESGYVVVRCEASLDAQRPTLLQAHSAPAGP